MTVTQQHVFNRASFIVTREHAANGLLLAKTETHGQTVTRFDYQYAPASPINPVRRFKNGALTGEYEWDSPIRLGKFLNYEDNFICEFFYADDDAGGALTKLRLTRASLCAVPFRDLPPERLAVRFALGALLDGFRPLELSCARDQVGTPKVLTGTFGKAVKVCDYSSFGVPVSDSFPQLFIPVGFAGGLADRDTGLVRFGWRDYDPEVGRFTAPDPARDTRGDGDLYGYCADDPVNRVDPTGLKFSRAAAVAGGESHRGISHPFGAPHGTSMGNAPAWMRPLSESEMQKMTAKGTLVAAAGNATIPATRNGTMLATQNATKAAPAWNKEKALEHLRREGNRKESLSKCGEYVGNAIEAGGIRLNRALNSTGRIRSACGYEPVLEAAGFKAVAVYGEPQAGDVVIIDSCKGHPHGHIAMYDGQVWISDHRQKDLYPGWRYYNAGAGFRYYRRQ